MDSNGSKAERIAQIDSVISSPDERAKHIFNTLVQEHPEWTQWDLVCFASNYLGFMSLDLPWLETNAKDLCRLVYTAHYLDTEHGDKSSVINKRNTGSSQPLTDDKRVEQPGKPEGKRSGIDVSGGGFTS